jgi:quinol monooxygenase YgiN
MRDQEERGETVMPTFNVVRFRVKPGQDQAFLDAHRGGKANWPGLVRGAMIRTGEGSYCLVGEWTDTDALASARASMIATLDSFRGTLEELGNGMGVTDAVSGPVVLDLKA